MVNNFKKKTNTLDTQYKARGSKKLNKVLMTSIVADDRERQVIPFFEEYEDIQVSTSRLTTGDYAILIPDTKNKKEGSPVVIIERKTWKDFSDSIKDGRISNNSNLEEFREKFGCKIVFIVEGAPFPSPNRKFRGIPFKNIQKKIDKMILVDGFHIIQTRDPKMTAQRIVELAIAYDQYYDDILKKSKPSKGSITGAKDDKSTKSPKAQKQTQKPHKKLKNLQPDEPDEDSEESLSSDSEESSGESNVSDQGNEMGEGEVELDDESAESSSDVRVEKLSKEEKRPVLSMISSELTKVRTKTNDRLLQEMWIALPQVSTATAKLLSEKWSIADIVSGKVFEMDIAELKYPGGTRIGNERAKKILIIAHAKSGNGNVATLKQSIEFTKAQEKLLRAINGVSAIVAKQICKKYTLKQLCEKVDEKELASIKRSDQPNARNIGPAVAKKILTLLRMKNE